MVSHLCPWLFIRAVTAWGTFTFIFCPRVSLSASLTKTTVAANAQRHGGHPVATGSRRLDRCVTRHCHGPTVSVRTPSAVQFLSCTKRLKSRVTSGSPNAGALVKSLFISLKAFSRSGPHSRGSLPDPAVALNKGLAFSQKPGIQILQHPAAPRNSQTSFLVFGQGIEQMACFLSCPSVQCPFDMTKPRYFTSCLQI